MAVKIVHPEANRMHRAPVMVVQVNYTTINPKAKFDGTLYGPDDPTRPVKETFRIGFASLVGFVYKGLVNGSYVFKANDGLLGNDNVTFKVQLTWAGPAPSWPLAGDTVSPLCFNAYGTSAVAVDLAANQTMVPSPTAALGGEGSGTAVCASYDPSSQSYQLGFGALPVGNYMLTVVDDNGTPNAQDPISVEN